MLDGVSTNNECNVEFHCQSINWMKFGLKRGNMSVLRMESWNIENEICAEESRRELLWIDKRTAQENKGLFEKLGNKFFVKVIKGFMPRTWAFKSSVSVPSGPLNPDRNPVTNEPFHLRRYRCVVVFWLTRNNERKIKENKEKTIFQGPKAFISQN